MRNGENEKMTQTEKKKLDLPTKKLKKAKKKKMRATGKPARARRKLQPKISIIVPAFNEEKCISECIESMNRQQGIARHDYEIIVIDARSTDRTVELAKKAGADRVIVETQKQTISFARQLGARAARSDIIIQTDADVIAAKNWLLELVVNGLEKAGPDIVAAQGALEPMPHGSKMPEQVFCKHVLPVYSKIMTKCHHLPHLGPNFAVRKEAFWKIKGYNTRLVTAEDIDLAHRLLKNGGKILFVPTSLIFISTRRIKKWGYWKYVTFHVSNMIKNVLFGKAHEYYEEVR